MGTELEIEDCPYKNRAFAGAWRDGWYGGYHGHASEENPYKGKTPRHGRVTFSMGFWRAWNNGHNNGRLCMRSQAQADPGT